MLTALGIGVVSKRSEISLDTTIGVFFTAAFASRHRAHVAGAKLRRRSAGLSVRQYPGHRPRDILIVTALTILVLGVVALFYKELLFASFDPVSAGATGLPVEALSYLLLVVLAITIIVSLQAAGIVLVAALLVTPAATAYQLTNKFGSMMIISACVGVGAAIVGLYLSYYLNVASGSTIVLVATACFFVAMLVSPKRRSLLTTLLDARRTAARVR